MMIEKEANKPRDVAYLNLAAASSIGNPAL